MLSKIGLFLCFILCLKTSSISTNKVIVEDFEIQKPPGEELSEDFDESDFLIKGEILY